MKNINYIKKLITLFIVFAPRVFSAETLDYTTEHLLEAAMNARYHSLPDVETDQSSNDLRFKLGYSQFSGGPSDSKVLLGSIQKTFSSDPNWTTVVYGFYDFAFIKTNSETVDAKIIKNQSPVIAQNSSVLLQSNHAYTHHVGLGLGETYRFNPAFALHFGLLGEIYTVKKFNLNFTTLNETTQFSGNINYNHTYLIYTPYMTLNWFPAYQIYGLQSILRLVLTYPLPRKDLARTVYVGNNQLNLETSSKHIPDFFAGIGYAIESPSKKWRVDLGATLDMIFLEGNVKHKGITKPIFFNYSFIY
jgi:hypothetical protein